MKTFEEEYIKFNKKRNLGKMISDTINFFKLEGKPFFLAVLKISIIPIVIAVALGTYYQLYDLEKTIAFDSRFISEYAAVLEWRFLISQLSLYVAYGFIGASSYSYIKSYWENKGKINFIEINTESQKKVFPYMGLSILTNIVIAIGFILLVIPGIYLTYVLSLAGCLLIFENRDVFDAFGRSFDFVKGYWWETFINILVFQILMVIIVLVLNIPMLFYGYDNIFGLESTQILISETPSEDPIYIGLIIFSQIIELISYLIILVFVAFVYFDIYERKHPSRDIIDSIGSE